MSVRVMTLVFRESKSTGTARLVLLALADVASEDGEVSAYKRSRSIIAAKANCAERSVTRAIRELEELGEVRVVSVGGGRVKTDYQITLAPLSGATDCPPTPDEVSPPTPDEVSPQGGRDVTPITTSLSIGDPFSSISAADAETQPPPKPSTSLAKPRPRDLIYDAIADACGVGLPAAKAMNGQIIAAKRDITEVEPGRSPEDLAQEVPRRAAVYRKKHPDWALTPNSLAKWWSSCAPDERNMREAYAQMDPVERLKVRLDLREQGMTDEQIKGITG